MKFPKFNKKGGLALVGIILIAFGGVSLVVAQRQPVRQILRLSLDGAYLGIEMEDVTADNMAKYKLASETGVIVRSVEKGSPAETARLQENDIILEYAGIPVFSAAELTRLVQETPVNRTVSLVISRDGKRSNLTLKVGERKDGVLSDRVQIVPPGEPGRVFSLNGRQFQFSQPGGGVFDFSGPGGNRALRYFMLSRPQLGVTVEAVTDQMATFLGMPGRKGALVTSVTQGSPAAAVLRAGDVIVSVDGKAVAEPADLTQALANKEPGSKVDLKVVRDKKEIPVAVEFPKSAAAARGIKI